MKQEKLDNSYYHEVIDRIHVVLCTIYEQIKTHPTIMQDDVARELIEAAEDNLSDAYQTLGQHMNDSDMPLTPWFPSDVKPVRDGLYLCEFDGEDDFILLCCWDNGAWYLSGIRLSGRHVPYRWRGLMVEQKE